MTVLDDRRIPGSKVSIKTIAISPAGSSSSIPRHYKGLVHTRRHGPISNLGPGRAPRRPSRTAPPSVEELGRQVEAVREALSSTGGGPRYRSRHCSA